MMSRWPVLRIAAGLVAFVCLVDLLAGCYAATRVSSNRHYFVDGYMVEGPLGRFHHDEDENKNEMVIGIGFDEKTYVDEGCDGTLDEIRFRGSVYRRESDDPTIPELFGHASAEYNKYYDLMFVHEIAENWAAWKAEGIASQNGFFKR